MLGVRRVVDGCLVAAAWLRLLGCGCVMDDCLVDDGCVEDGFLVGGGLGGAGESG